MPSTKRVNHIQRASPVDQLTLRRSDTLLFRNTVEAIGERICQQALWDSDCCAWDVPTTPPESSPLPPSYALCDGSIYGGTAGIGLFLAELFRATDQASFRKAAIGAYRHAKTCFAAQADRAPVGFFSGLTGQVYAACRYAAIFRDEEFLEDAVWSLKRLRVIAPGHPQLDVIGGAAGAIPALLSVRAQLANEKDVVDDVLSCFGEQLVRAAVVTPAGWAWFRTAGDARHLTGLAHGSAGAGLALLELAVERNDADYRFASEQAFAHERSEFDARTGNWHDLRNLEIYDLVRSLRTLTMQQWQALRVEPWQSRAMVAWCHGAPGIALSRLRAWSYTGEERYLVEAKIALDTTRHSLRREGNFSLCHGHFGNCESLLHAAAVLAEPSLSDDALSCAREGCETFERPDRSWPTGSWFGAPDVSLMKGEAGIGLFLLRLLDMDVCHPLMPIAWPRNVVKLRDTSEAVSSIERHVKALYPSTWSALTADSRTAVIQALSVKSRGTPLSLSVVRDCLDDASSRDAGDRAAEASANQFDLARLSLWLRPLDFGWLEVQQQRARVLSASVRSDSVLFPNPAIAIVRPSQAPPSTLPQGDDLAASRDDRVQLLVRSPEGVTVQNLSELAATILSVVSSDGDTWKRVADLVLAQLTLESAHSRDDVLQAINSQLMSATRAGYLLFASTTSRHGNS